MVGLNIGRSFQKYNGFLSGDRFEIDNNPKRLAIHVNQGPKKRQIRGIDTVAGFLHFPFARHHHFLKKEKNSVPAGFEPALWHAL